MPIRQHETYSLQLAFPALASAGLLSLWLSACAGGSTPAGPVEGILPGQTNLLLVILDTTRADHLGAWGYAQDTSPEIDRLAAEGVRFSRFHATAPWTRPSMASLLTGLYPRSTGVFEERFDVLGEDLVTLAERMQSAGYVTLGLTSNPNINAWFQFDQGFDEYIDADALWDWLPGQDQVSMPNSGPVPAQEMTRRALALVDRHSQALQQRPYFLQTLYIDPHRPYRKHQVRFQGANAWYDGEIRYMDTNVGALLAGLEKRGLLEDTLVILTADHGEGLDSHPGVPVSDNHGYHLFQSTLHVPLILWHRQLKPRLIPTPSSSVDLLPTLAELFGWSDFEGPGRSFAAALGGAALPEDGFLFAETDWRQASKVSVMGNGARYIQNLDSIAFQTHGRFEGYKALRPLLKLAPYQLFDVRGADSENPALNNLWDPDGGGKHVSDQNLLAGLLKDWIKRYPRRAPQKRSSEDVDSDGEGQVQPTVSDGYEHGLEGKMQDQLKALGYMGDD